jgi:hypothetical protein
MTPSGVVLLMIELPVASAKTLGIVNQKISFRTCDFEFMFL